MVGGITVGILNYPPNSTKTVVMLTDAQVRKIKPLEKKTKYVDEKGMYLEVTPSGGMHWRMKFRLNSKENIFSIGTYPETTLAQACRARDEA